MDMPLGINPDGLRFDPEQHEIIDGCLWTASLRGKLQEPNLFLYRHKITKNFVLACWWGGPPGSGGDGAGIMCEFRCWPVPPTKMDFSELPSADEIARIHLRPSREAYKEAMDDIEAAEVRKAEEKAVKIERLQDRSKRMQKAVGIHKADHPDIVGIATGDYDWEPLPEND